MAQLLQPYDATQFDPTQGVGQLPVGKHLVKIVNSEVKANKDNTGGYLQVSLQSAEGLSGVMRYNIYSSSQQAVEIANRQLSALCHVLGVFNVQETSVLHNIPFVVEVQQQRDNPQYTEVARVFDANGNEPGKGTQGGQAQPQQQQAPVQQQAPAQTGWGVPQQQSQPEQQPNQSGAGWAQPEQQQQPPVQNQGWQQNQQPPQQTAPWGAPKS